MKFTEILTPENIRQGVVFSSKKTMFEALGRMVGDQIPNNEFSSQQCFSNLFNREKLGCTALANGVAMPRAKLPSDAQPIAIFLQLAEPLDYDAVDKRPVDLVFAVLIPGGACAQYIPVLEKFAEKFTDKTLCKQLRTAQSADEIWQILEYTDNYSDENSTKEHAEQ